MPENKRGFLVVSIPHTISDETKSRIVDVMTPIAEGQGFNLIVADNGATISVYHDLDPLIEALGAQVVAINRIIESNSQLIMAIASTEPDPEDKEPERYLDGSEM